MHAHGNVVLSSSFRAGDASLTFYDFALLASCFWVDVSGDILCNTLLITASLDVCSRYPPTHTLRQSCSKRLGVIWTYMEISVARCVCVSCLLGLCSKCRGRYSRSAGIRIEYSDSSLAPVGCECIRIIKCGRLTFASWAGIDTTRATGSQCGPVCLNETS